MSLICDLSLAIWLQGYCQLYVTYVVNASYSTAVKTENEVSFEYKLYHFYLKNDTSFILEDEGMGLATEVS